MPEPLDLVALQREAQDDADVSEWAECVLVLIDELEATRAERDDWREQARTNTEIMLARAERAEAAIARVEALISCWDNPDLSEDWVRMSCAESIRAALRGDHA